jgi:ribosomal protein S18 acetylase RimI-like enzyme
MRVKIREAVKSDLEDIQELNLESWLKAYDGIIPEEKMREGISYPEDRLLEKKNDNKLIFLVAVVDEKVVGTINFCFSKENTHDFVDTDEGEAQLRSVYMHPDYWGNGIGTRIFEEGKELLPNNIGSLKVESLEENEIGRGFYSKLGFKQIARNKVELFGDKYETVIQKKELVK